MRPGLGLIYFSVEKLAGPRHGFHVAAHESSSLDAPCSWVNMLNRLQNDIDLGHQLSKLLEDTAFPDFFWECRPVSWSSAERQPFDFVVLDAQGSLNRSSADSTAFSHHLNNATSPVVSFPNLGHDATLVVPAQLSGIPSDAYGHLAAFVRHAPSSQQPAFWQAVGEVMERSLKKAATEPVWLNTAGNGVPWVHVRTDSWPKYVKYNEFKTFAPSPLRSLGDSGHARGEL